MGQRLFTLAGGSAAIDEAQLDEAALTLGRDDAHREPERRAVAVPGDPVGHLTAGAAALIDEPAHRAEPALFEHRVEATVAGGGRADERGERGVGEHDVVALDERDGGVVGVGERLESLPVLSAGLAVAGALRDVAGDDDDVADAPPGVADGGEGVFDGRVAVARRDAIFAALAAAGAQHRVEEALEHIVFAAGHAEGAEGLADDVLGGAAPGGERGLVGEGELAAVVEHEDLLGGRREHRVLHGGGPLFFAAELVDEGAAAALVGDVFGQPGDERLAVFVFDRVVAGGQPPHRAVGAHDAVVDAGDLALLHLAALGVEEGQVVGVDGLGDPGVEVVDGLGVEAPHVFERAADEEGLAGVGRREPHDVRQVAGEDGEPALGLGAGGLGVDELADVGEGDDDPADALALVAVGQDADERAARVGGDDGALPRLAGVADL